MVKEKNDSFRYPQSSNFPKGVDLRICIEGETRPLFKTVAAQKKAKPQTFTLAFNHRSVFREELGKGGSSYEYTGEVPLNEVLILLQYLVEYIKQEQLGRKESSTLGKDDDLS